VAGLQPNLFLQTARAFDTEEQQQLWDNLSCGLTDEQRTMCNAIIESVNHGAERPSNAHFLLAPAGTGKTYALRTLLAWIHSQDRVAITVASSGIAALLYDGGRTGHSVFCIPLDCHETSVSGITKNSPEAELLRAAELIVWDEAPMMSRYVYECLDCLLQDVCDTKLPFGGKTVVLAGDYRQILPVVRRRTTAQVLDVTLVRSHLWNSFRLHSFMRNMRIATAVSNGGAAADIEEM
jgi:ATP-dependent DNA helicase PIF1